MSDTALTELVGPKRFDSQFENHRDAIIHEVETGEKYFWQLIQGVRRFDVRHSIRGYIVGDVLAVFETKNGSRTGRSAFFFIGFVLEGPEAEAFGVEHGYCVLDLRRIPSLDKSELPSPEREMP